MKRPLLVVLALSLMLAAAGVTAEKKPKRRAGPPSTLPPKSPMIVVPPVPDAAIKSGEPPKLISSEMSGKDLQFFTTAVDAGRWQAYLVGLLQTRAGSEQIKALGAALAATQEEENRQIARLAGIKGWNVSTEPTAAQKKAGAELEKQAGSDFDKAVMDKVIAASQQSVSAYEAAAQSSDAEIKSFAGQMLPLAQEKLRLTEKMTGAGKSAAQLFRTGAPPAAIKPTASPSAKDPVASGPAKSPAPAKPTPIPPPTTK